MTTPEVDSTLGQDILELEKRRIAAMVGQNLATLDGILADDLTYVHSGGRIDTKASFLEMIRTGETRYRGVDFSGVDVRPCGSGWLVRGRAQIRLLQPNGEELSYPVWFLDAYAPREGRWQMVAWQATRIPE